MERVWLGVFWRNLLQWTSCCGSSRMYEFVCKIESSVYTWYFSWKLQECFSAEKINSFAQAMISLVRAWHYLTVIYHSYTSEGVLENVTSFQHSNRGPTLIFDWVSLPHVLMRSWSCLWWLFFGLDFPTVFVACNTQYVSMDSLYFPWWQLLHPVICGIRVDHNLSLLQESRAIKVVPMLD